MTMIETPETAEVIEEAITERVEDSNSTALEIVETEAERDIRLAQIAADAAVEIAEVQAEAMEVDDIWLASRFDAVEDALREVLTRLGLLETDLQTIAVAILAASPPAPSIQTPQLETLPTPAPIAPPEPAPEPASVQLAAKRKRVAF